MTRVFLVDSDDSSRERIRDTLSRRGLDVTSYRSPLEAMAGISANSPDLLISDLQSPEMSGFELVEAARAEKPGLPVILMTEDPSAPVRAKANAQGVEHVVDKNVGESSELLHAIESELSWGRAFETVRELDEIRMGFFTDLSHQLRTPLTAMSLAIDALFLHLRSAMKSPQRELARVSRRNVDRVINLVENQLDLLQVMVGESRISRRLVDLRKLVEGITDRISSEEKRDDLVSIRICEEKEQDGPFYVFTDPDPLITIIDCLLGGAANVTREICLEYDPSGQIYRLDINLDYLDENNCCARIDETDEVPVCICGKTRFDFEYRAYNSLLGQLGGDVTMIKNTDRKRVQIFLPRYPEFDRHKDFLNPVRILRSIAEEKCQNVSFVKCDLGGDLAADYLDRDESSSHDFLLRVESVLSEKDLVLRGRQPRTIYLALMERSQHELDHVKSFLDGHPRGCRRDDGLYVSRPLAIVQDYGEVIELMRELELV